MVGFIQIHSSTVDLYKPYYLERGVRQMVQIKDLNLFQQFLQLCAGYVGQLIDNDALSNALGVSASTIKQWLSILEASYAGVQTQRIGAFELINFRHSDKINF